MGSQGGAERVLRLSVCGAGGAGPGGVCIGAQGLEEASRRQWRAKASKSTKKRSDKRDRIQGQGTVSTKYMKSLPPQKWEGARRFEVRQQEMAEKR